MVREVVDGFELPAEKVHLVPNGVDPALWAAAGAQRQAPRGAARARLGPRPVREGLPGAGAGDRAALRHRVPGIRCVIAGRGSYLAELQTQIDIEGVSDLVQLAGFVPDDELRALLHRPAASSSRRCTSRSASSPWRRMAAGAPAVVARTGGLAEIVEGTGAGLLFEPGNADAAGRR